MDHEEDTSPPKRDERTYAIIGAAMEVHTQLGSGFLEAVYQEAMEIELELRGIPAKPFEKIEVFYKGHKLKTHYEPDLICYDAVVVELKAVKHMTTVEEAQVINYLKATGFKVGLLFNFGEGRLVYKRYVN